MIANDINKLRALAVSLHIAKMEKSLVAFGFRGDLVSGKKGIEFHCNKLSVLHLVLSRTGMN